MTNDNRTIDQVVRASAMDRAERQKRLTAMDHLPDLGVQLKPEVEARLRDQARNAGVDYDAFVELFEAGYQVIPTRPSNMTRELMRKRVIPINALPIYLEGHLDMAIYFERASKLGACCSSLHGSLCSCDGTSTT